MTVRHTRNREKAACEGSTGYSPASTTTQAKLPVIIGVSEPEQRRQLEKLLASSDLGIWWAQDGDAIAALLGERAPRLILLSWDLKPKSGCHVCRRLRREAMIDDVPIVMLTNDEEADTYIAALESGADCSIATSSHSPTLIARIRSILQLRGTACYRRGDLELDLARGLLRRNGRLVMIGPIELRLLGLLMAFPERVFSRDELRAHGWRPDVCIANRTVDVHMAHLRKALCQVGKPDPIRTVHTVGYALSSWYVAPLN